MRSLPENFNHIVIATEVSKDLISIHTQDSEELIELLTAQEERMKTVLEKSTEKPGHGRPSRLLVVFNRKTKDVTIVRGCVSITGCQGGFPFVFTEGQKARFFEGTYCHGAYSNLSKGDAYLLIDPHQDYNSVLLIC